MLLLEMQVFVMRSCVLWRFTIYVYASGSAQSGILAPCIGACGSGLKTMSEVFSVVLRLGGVLLLVALNGFFVAAEFALVGARRTRLEQIAASGNAAAALGRRMQEDLDRYIAAAQLGITLASLALGWIGESTIAELVEPPIETL